MKQEGSTCSFPYPSFCSLLGFSVEEDSHLFISRLQRATQMERVRPKQPGALSKATWRLMVEPRAAVISVGTVQELQWFVLILDVEGQKPHVRL